MPEHHSTKNQCSAKPNHQKADTVETYGKESANGMLSDIDKGTNSVVADRVQSVTSERSGRLDLTTLRQEIIAEGSICQTIVRLETPFGKPIEEIYDGVQDGQVLGSGVSGVVRRITHRSTGVQYACKCLDIFMVSSVDVLRQLRDEVSIMCQLDHPNIVRIEEVYESESDIYIVQELCTGGDLFDRLDEQPDLRYTEVQCAKIVKQMLSAVRYLHSKGIIHRDLKLENFLFNSRKEDSHLKMIDFGLSKHFELGQSLDEKVGTPYTVAPEIIRGNYNEKCDVWSIGVITYLLLCGETPFGGLDGEKLSDVRDKIMRAQVRFKPEDIWDSVSEEGKNFVKLLLHPNPDSRPSASEAQQNSWITVWATNDSSQVQQLSRKTLRALMAFKESSDMQKLLSEVLAFTLLPEQIEELRIDFEKIDSNGDGEISLSSLKRVLLENAGEGALGSLNEDQIEEIFNSIRVGHSEPKIRWHEFLAAGMSKARIDDRNLRLAFDRLDVSRKGFISFDDLVDVLGSTTGYDDLEKMWRESLSACKTPMDQITFQEFKLLMKGQPKVSGNIRSSVRFSMNASLPGNFLLEPVPETKPSLLGVSISELGVEDLAEEDLENARQLFQKKRSATLDNVFHRSDNSLMSHRSSWSPSARPPIYQNQTEDTSDELTENVSPLVANRTVYRKHRGMRLAVLEASKQFDGKREFRRAGAGRASLIMRRGATTPIELEDKHLRMLFDKAAEKSGRSRHRKDKTVSDLSGMLNDIKR